MRIAVIAVVAGLVLTAGGVGYVRALGSRLDRLEVALHPSAPGGETYLVVGTDSRAGLTEQQRQALGSTPGERADIVLLVRVPDGGGEPTLLSIPRDLLVLGDDYGLHRLALVWRYGPQAFVDALCTSLGVGADHLVRVELAGFAGIVDAAGGVDIDFPYPLRDRLIDFAVDDGRQHLGGLRALQYVRARQLEHLTAFGWFPLPNQRSEQARAVFAAVGRKVSSGRNPVVLHRVLWAATGAVGVDRSTGVRDLWALARAARGLPEGAQAALPAAIDDGPIPFAQLLPGAGEALRRAGAGGTGCPVPALPGARADAVVPSARGR